MTEQKRETSELMKLIIYLAIVGIGWFVPPMGGITWGGMKIIFLFIATCYGWSVSNQIWPSLMGLVLIPCTGIMSFTAFLAAGWGADLGLFTVLIFILIAFFSQTKLDQFIATWLLSRKFLVGHPWRIVFMVLFAAYLVCTLTQVMVGIFLFWQILYSMSKTLGYKPYDKFPTLMAIGIGIMGALSLSAMPWGMNAIVLLAFFEKMMGAPLDLAKYITYTLPYNMLVIAGFLLACKFIFRLDVSRLKDMDMSFLNQDDLKLTPEKKVGLIALTAFILLLVLPIFLPKTWVLTSGLNYIGYTGKTILVVVALIVVRINGKPVFEFNQLAKAINWPLLGIIMVVVPLGACISSPASGVSQYITKVFLPYLQGMPALSFLIGLSALVVILTNVMANMPVAMMLMPVAMTGAIAYGFPKEMVGYLVIVTCTIAWMLPSASPSGMLMFGNKEWLKPKDIWVYGGVMLVLCTVLAILVNYIWLPLFY